MPKLACCRTPCDTCIYPCDPPPENPRDVLYYFTPCEDYIGPPACGWEAYVEVKTGGIPMNPSGAGCVSSFVQCPDSAPTVFSARLTYLCLYGDATNGYEYQWSGWSCPSVGGYPLPICVNNYPGGAVTEIGGPQFVGYCNPSACATVSPCTCSPQYFLSLSQGQFTFYNVNDPISPFYDPQPWTDVIEIERVCCWERPPDYQWFTISGAGDIMGIGDQNPGPVPIGHRCNVITQSASGQSMAQALRVFLGADYKIMVLTDEVYWAGGAYYELVWAGCAGKLMSCEDQRGCGCKGRYLADEWRVNYIDDCRAVVQARHFSAMAIGAITFSVNSNVQESEVPPGSGNYVCSCAGSSSGVAASVVPTNAVLITYGNNITGSSFSFDYDFVTDPNQCDGAPGNCTWCNMGGGLPTVT